MEAASTIAVAGDTVAVATTAMKTALMIVVVMGAVMTMAIVVSTAMHLVAMTVTGEEMSDVMIAAPIVTVIPDTTTESLVVTKPEEPAKTDILAGNRDADISSSKTRWRYDLFEAFIRLALWLFYSPFF